MTCKNGRECNVPLHMIYDYKEDNTNICSQDIEQTLGICVI